MKRSVRVILILIGMLILVFTLNLVAYTAVPSDRSALKNAVSGDAGDTAGGKTFEKVPQEEVPGQGEIQEKKETDVRASFPKESGSAETQTTTALDGEYVEKREAADTNKKESIQEKKPSIIDKEYHEDCGTGEGYWIIKYEDGTMEIE